MPKEPEASDGPEEHAFDADLADCETPKTVRRWLRFMLRWVSPPVIAFGLIVSVVDLVQKWFVA